MNLTSIIIPTYNALSMLQDVIQSIAQHTDARETPYEIIVVDNGSQDGTAAWCARQGLQVLSLPANTGFPTACNQGLKFALGSDLMLLNNDVLVADGWLSGLTRTLHQAPDIGIVGPKSNYVHGKQKLDTPLDNVAEYPARAAAMRDDPALQAPLEVQRLVGFCFLFTRTLYDAIGELDERFSPGHYEDDDYCMRARLSGYRLFIDNAVFVYHKGNVSFDVAGNKQQHVEAGRRKYIEKWNVDPAKFH
jgi:GT2 family glycosyltransferase